MSTGYQILAPPYHIQTTQAKTLPNPESFPHHQSVSALWATKWKAPCSMGIYPFMDGKLEDFEPIFQKLIELSAEMPDILNVPDAYLAPFIPVAEALVERARKVEEEGDTALAKELYLRGAAVYRIARFPYIWGEREKEVWRKQKEAYARGSAYLSPPNQEISIPFRHVDVSQGDMDKPIEAYIRVPQTPPATSAGYPILLFICGLDSYRTDNTLRTQAYVDAGFVTISFEIPGTGDCPAAPADPFSPDRIMTSVLDWVDSNSARYNLDTAKVCIHSISTGSYYGFRAAHTHGDRLFAVAAQGGGSHHMFDEQWINAQNQMEYPFAIAEALAYKFGYPDVSSYAKDSNARSKFSLVDGEAAVLERQSCKMLIINGMEDSIFPIEDSILVAMKGQDKDLLCRGGKRHMGSPGAEEIIVQWLRDRVAGKP